MWWPFEKMYLWLQANPYIGMLFILMITDVLIGILVATKTHRLSSSVSGDGMRRKAVMILLVAVGKAVGLFIVNETPDSPLASVANLLAVGFCLPEFISIVENAALLGVPVPSWLVQYFERLTPGAPPKSQTRDPREVAFEQELLKALHARRHSDRSLPSDPPGDPL